MPRIDVHSVMRVIDTFAIACAHHVMNIDSRHGSWIHDQEIDWM